jgi:hypothetical protein
MNVALITEAHLTPAKNIRIPRYILYRIDHPNGTAHAGTTILDSTNIEHKVLPQYQQKKLFTIYKHTN